MKVLSVYKDIQVTFREVDGVLHQLGFQAKVIDRKDVNEPPIKLLSEFIILFKNEKEKVHFAYPFVSWESKMLKGDFASLSHQLFQLGFIDNYEMLGKMIEKNRQVKLERA